MYQQPSFFQSNKRSSIQRHNHVGYHPYYSSSPLGVTTSNLHCASNSSTSSITSTSSSSQKGASFKKEILLSKNEIQKFDLKNSLICDGIHNQTFNEDENDLSSLSTRTNPPTTPTSSTSTNNTPSNIDEEASYFKCKENRIINHLTTENILNVTPVTSNSSASSVSNIKLISQDKYSASCSSSCTTSSAVSTCSNMQATYSRSSSTASLSSFDIKSIHSSAASEYSCANRQETLSTGLITPSGYSDLPDSPGEIFPYTAMNRNKNILNLNNSENSQHRYLTKLINSTGSNEISVLTFDSNPSRSNDITIVEKTVLACTATNNSNNNTNLTVNFGNSGYSTFIQNEEDPNAINVSALMDDDEKVVAYDVEGSLCGSTRSNISSLTFPQEPTADLTFIRNLLSKKSSVTNLTTDKMADKKHHEQQQSFPVESQIRLWSKCLFNTSTSFTPPIKLKSDEIINNSKKLNFKTNKKLSYEIEEDQTQNVEDEDDDCSKSITSIPSDIFRDNNTLNLNKSNFSALFNKLTSNLDLLKDTYEFVESSPLVNKTDKMVYQFNKPSDFSQNQLLENSFENTNNQSHIISNNLDISTKNQDINFISKKKLAKKNEEDNDEKILQDFIDEMLPIALANNKQNSENYENDSLNEYDETELQRYQKIYQDNDLHNHVPLSSILSKIDEENEDEDEIELPLIKNIKRNISSVNPSKSVIVQMTKTTMLRVNKVLQTKSNLKASNTPATFRRTSNQNKINFISEKRQALSSSSSINSIQSKPSNSTFGFKSSSLKKVALTPINKLNKNLTLSTIKRSNTLNKT